MIRSTPLSLLLCFALAVPAVSFARDIPPFVSTDWLDQNLSAPGLTIIDVRSQQDYRKGHIPKAVNTPLSSWTVNSGLLRELPAESDLLRLIGSIGIKENSKVIVMGNSTSDFDRADPIRVAWTLLMAGVKNVAVLDGGFPKWLKEKRPTTADPTPPQTVEFKGKINTSRLASKDYILSKIGKSILLDNRTSDIYFGINTEPWASKPGHIPSAVNLPTPWAFGQNGLLKAATELESMANGVVGKDKTKEIITYCGVGAYASVWSYILTEMLGYKEVKVFDGSMQEWVMDAAGPIEIYSWH
jgi:thiosulfate/3-mercaptopyruvate sulfurtransferase